MPITKVYSSRRNKSTGLRRETTPLKVNNKNHTGAEKMMTRLGGCVATTTSCCHSSRLLFAALMVAGVSALLVRQIARPLDITSMAHVFHLNDHQVSFSCFFFCKWILLFDCFVIWIWIEKTVWNRGRHLRKVIQLTSRNVFNKRIFCNAVAAKKTANQFYRLLLQVTTASYVHLLKCDCLVYFQH